MGDPVNVRKFVRTHSDSDPRPGVAPPPATRIRRTLRARMTTLTARSLITASGSIDHPVLTLDGDGCLLEIGSDPSVASEDTLAPAFLDIHLHGSAGQDVMSADPAGLATLQRFLARRGTARYLPTTVTAPIDQTLAALERLAAAIEQPRPNDEAAPIGIHLEGPFISHAKRGVQPAEFIQPPSIQLFDRLQRAARGHIRLMTIAPEVSGALDLIRHAAAQGVHLSLGHSNALAAETLAAIAAGATSATHTFNAMRPLDHREPGILGTVLDDTSLFAELICDGIHVAPPLVRLWLRLKAQRSILVTDAMAAAGLPDGPSTLAGLPVTVAHGRASLTHAPETLAGSVLTLDRAVANLIAFTGCPLAEALRCAAAHPAAMLGLPSLDLAPGTPVHLNRFDASGRLIATYLRGHVLSAQN